MTTRVLRIDHDFVTLPLIDAASGEARAIVWPGMGARHRSLHHLRLRARAASVSQRHPSEAVYYVVRGAGTIEDLDSGASHPLRGGSFAHVTPNSRYRLVAGETELICIGGPCPPDPALYPLP